MSPDHGITFRPLTTGDLPMLVEWLARPHVAEWWGTPKSLTEVEDHYGPAIAGVIPQQCYIAIRNDDAFGFIQSYTPVGWHHEGWWLDEHDPGVRGVDQFLARADDLGHGLGTAMTVAFLSMLFDDPAVTRVQIDPAPHNARAIRCYEKAGLSGVALRPIRPVAVG